MAALGVLCFFYQLLTCIHSIDGSALRSGYLHINPSDYFAGSEEFCNGRYRYRFGVTDSVLGIRDP